MKPNYKKHFTTAALIWAGCLVLLSFVYMLVLSPQNKSKKDIEKQAYEKRQIYNTALKAAQEKTKRAIKKQIEDLESSLARFAIDGEDSANLIFDISQIASEKEVGAFSIGEKSKRRGSEIPGCNYISEHQIDISFTGGFNQFATLLNALERHRPVVFVDSFSISRSDKGDTNHRVGMDLSVFVKKGQDS